MSQLAIFRMQTIMLARHSLARLAPRPVLRKASAHAAALRSAKPPLTLPLRSCRPAPPAAASEDQASMGGSADFDWELGVSLATCSFEAYAEVETRGLTEKTQDGSEIVYTDAHFLKEKLAGVLKVTLHRAAGLPAADEAPGDPFCVVTLGDDSFATSAAQRGEAPQWERESGTLFVRDAARQRLSIRVLPAGKGSGPLGTALRGVADLADGQRREEALELRGRGDGGKIWVTLQFVPFTDPVLADNASQSEMGGSVVGAPGRGLMPDDWRRLERKLMAAALPCFTPVAFVESVTTDTELWCFWNRRRRVLVLTFRGTEQNKWKDVLTDISMTPVNLATKRVAEAPRRAALADISAQPSPIAKMMSTVEQAKREVAAKRQVEEGTASPSPPSSAAATAAAVESAAVESAAGGGDGAVSTGHGDEGRAAEQGGGGQGKSAMAAAVDAVMATASDLQDVLSRVKAAIDAAEEERPPAEEPWVHSGFLTAYDSVRAEVLGLVDTTLAGEDAPWTVALTGHSLGGALATLCAYDLAVRRWSKRPALAMYNYGSPRVGNSAFAAEFNARVPNAWRILNKNDAVCTVPRLMGYCHVGHAVIMKEGGEVEVQRNTSEAPFEGTAVPQVLPAVGAAVTAAVASAVPQVMKSAGMEIAAVASGGTLDAGEEQDMAAHDAGNVEKAAPAPDDYLSSLWEAEKEAWSLLFGGGGVEPHLEHYYFDALNTAVDRLLEDRQRGDKAATEPAASPGAGSGGPLAQLSGAA